jgi:hypothetical protein
MGSVLSFPILCSCNLTAYWFTLEQYLGRTVQMRDLPVLVNGDDILFRTNDKFYRMWLDNIVEMGFELSLGKNYVHSKFLMINSESYWRTQSGFESIPYYNIGLLIGQSKLQRDSSLAPVWDYYNKVVLGSANKCRAHYRFFSLNRVKISRVTFNGLYNCFIDPHFGGLGFNIFPETRGIIKFTTFQRQFGHYLLNRDKLVQGILPSNDITLIQEKKAKRQLVTRRHFGNYKLVPYHTSGSLLKPIYTLVLDENERIAPNLQLPKPILSELPNIGELVEEEFKGKSRLVWKISKDMSVRSPRPEVLRSFRLNKPVIRSVGKLLTQPRAWVEVMSAY